MATDVSDTGPFPPSTGEPAQRTLRGGRDPDQKNPLDEQADLAAPNTANLLSWGLFWRHIFSQAGLLFLLAGIACFFAFNWADLPAFAKFGLLIGLMLASLALTLLRGPDSSPGGLGLLACGLLAGPLLAVFGQTYQTGANASELFLAWAIVILPLALAGKRTALWLSFWAIGGIWLWLYELELYAFDWNDWDAGWNALASFMWGRNAQAQAAFLLLWEAAAFFLAGPARGFLYSRLVPRLVALTLLTQLTWTLARLILASTSSYWEAEVSYSWFFSFGPLAYAFCIAAGGWWYSRRRPDILILAMGMLSLIITALFFVFSHESTWNIGGAVLGALMVIGFAALAERALRHCLRNARPLLAGWDQRRREAAEWQERESAARKNRQQAEQVLPSLFNWQALQFALTSRLPAFTQIDQTGEDQQPGTHEASPWFVRLLVGLCAWIALPLILAVLGLLLFDVLNFRDESAFTFISLVALGIGAAMATSGSLFVRQFALALALAGTVGASATAALTMRLDETVFLIPAIFICAGGFCVMRNPAYRFGAALAVCIMLYAQLILSIFGPQYYRYDYGYEEAFHAPILFMFFDGTVYTLLSLLLVRLHFLPEAPGREPWLIPLRTGILVSFLCIPLLDMLNTASLLPGPFLPMTMIGVGAGIGLGWHVARTLRPFRVAPATRALFLAAAALVALASYHYPWLGAGFLCLALARKERSLPLVGLSVAFLAAAVNIEYYSLNTTLLMKAVSLSLVGLLFLGMALAVSRRLTAGVLTGRLPAPLKLLCLSLRTADDVSAEDALFSAPKESPGSSLIGSTTASGIVGQTPSPVEELKTGPWPRLLLARSGLIAATITIFLIGFGLSVHAKEELLANGTRILLRMAPVDPRSLMQGDYMILDFAIARDIRSALGDAYDEEPPARAVPRKNRAVVHLDKDGLGTFVCLDAEDAAPLEPEERYLVFKRKGWNGVQVGSGAFFFQEGHGEAFDKARFAEGRVDENGVLIITHLLDEKMRRIEPGGDTKGR